VNKGERDRGKREGLRERDRAYICVYKYISIERGEEREGRETERWGKKERHRDGGNRKC
jgi:hypothetical protein